MRNAFILLAFFLLAWQQPAPASAQRAGSPRAAKTKQAVRPVKAAKTRTRTNVRPSARKAVVTLGKKTGAALKMRASVKAQTKTTRSNLKNGQVTNAALEISRSPLRNAQGQFVQGPKKVSIRERFALWRSTRAVKRTAIAQAKGRSAKGDVQGTADALNALIVLESGGKLGIFARWQKTRATKKAFKNLNRSARESLGRGEVDAAGQSFAFAAELASSPRQNKKAANKLIKESFALAKTYSKSGNPDLTWKVLEMASAIANRGGAKFSEKKAQKLVDKSFVAALPVLTTAAAAAYKSGEVDQAVQLLAEARSIQQGGSAKASRSVTRQQKRLAQKLGPRLVEFEAQMAAQAQGQEAAQAEQVAAQ
jgi:hypothetical protein